MNYFKGVTSDIGRLPSVPLLKCGISEVRRYRYSVALRCVWDYLGHMRVLLVCQDARNDFDTIPSPDFRSRCKFQTEYHGNSRKNVIIISEPVISMFSVIFCVWHFESVPNCLWKTRISETIRLQLAKMIFLNLQFSKFHSDNMKIAEVYGTPSGFGYFVRILDFKHPHIDW